MKIDLTKNGVPKNVQWLFERCLIYNFTSLEKISNIIKNKKKAYVGFDVTKPSLQLGNMVSLNLAELLTEKGVETYIVLGGATTLVGDPSGKKEERGRSKKEEIEDSFNKIKSFLKKHYPSLKVLNNKDWWSEINTIEFLRMTKSFGINYLLDRQIIKERLKTTGISYTEFSYTLIQGLDFFHLYNKKDVMMQVGGSDQWGNFLSGYDMISKESDDVACFSTSLLVDGSGQKFGKTMGNAIFLDKDMTSSYEMYQAIKNFSDNYINILFRMLTNIKTKEVEKIVKMHKEKPYLRVGQETLAEFIITKTRSEKDYLDAKRISQLLFKMDYSSMKKEDIDFLKKSNSFFKLDKGEKSISEILQIVGFVSSKSDAKRLIKSKGIKINNITCEEDNTLQDYEQINKLYFVSKGKKNIAVVSLR